MGLLDHFKGQPRSRKDMVTESGAPGRAAHSRGAEGYQAKPVVRPPTGFLSWVMLATPAGDRIPCIMRRLLPADVMPLSRWPAPTYFDWLGLVEGRPSGRHTRAQVNYEKPLRLEVLETLPFADVPAEIVGAMALCDHPKDRPDALELAYLEKNPDSPLVGFGTAALALALVEARTRGMAFFLDALIKSHSNLFYKRCGMVEVDGTPWPTMTVRMEFPSDARTDVFLDKVREKQIIP